MSDLLLDKASQQESTASPDMRQKRASNPNHTVWLEANAGSGKTKVLTDRVARLLLSGVDPGRILCLTYTTAAATEMQNRLFKRLGAWSMAEDTDLAAEIIELQEKSEPPPDKRALNEARRLFAQAVEVPGGLKIQTFHAFATRLLRQFPREAGVSPDFRVIDAQEAELIKRQVLDELFSSEEGKLLYSQLAKMSTSTIPNAEKLAGECITHKKRLIPERNWLELAAAFHIDPTLTEQQIWENMLGFSGKDALQALKSAIPDYGTKTEKEKLLPALQAIQEQAPSARIRSLARFMLFSSRHETPFAAKIGAFPSKKLRETLQETTLPSLEALMLATEKALEDLNSLEAYHRSKAMQAFADAYLREHSSLMQKSGLIDFSDMIDKVTTLLTDPALGPYILWKLDNWIDHILVDEAQDTSPEQWQVIEAFCAEFTAGASAHPRPRHLFVVGDPKQSIYSFQGANAAAFALTQKRFRKQFHDGGLPVETVELEHSFRSSPAILNAVDATMQTIGINTRHHAFWHDMPGRVDLWPLISPGPPAPEDDWRNPVDLRGSETASRRLARKIASDIQSMLAKETLPSRQNDGSYRSRPVRPGDIMILVQRRSSLFEDILLEIKALNLPVAGADRLKLGAELAVKDLLAVLSVVLLPEDSLSLAAALRSPIFGWDERALFQLAAPRGEKESLFAALRRLRSNPEEEYHSLAQTSLSLFESLASRADFVRPFDLLDHILSRFEGRKKLIGRLGEEAADGIDALLAQALAYEQSETPSLTGFLAAMETEELEIQRRPSDQADLIRVMTVHGAKGLERPIVILPDTLRAAPTYRDLTIPIADGLLAWRSPEGARPKAEEEALSAWRSAQEAERQRLLYVAMTRAESWLIVCGASSSKNDGKEDWHGYVETALTSIGAQWHSTGEQGYLRHEQHRWDLEPVDAIPEEANPSETEYNALLPLPDILSSNSRFIASDLRGAKSLPGPANQDADGSEYGTALHLLLSRLPLLPKEDWEKEASQLLGEKEDFPDIFSQANQLISHPALSDIFAPETLAEASLSASIPALGGALVHGVMDRLILNPELQIIDFKSNSQIPKRAEDCPEGILRQMAAYRAILKEIYPERDVIAEVIWTSAPLRMPLPGELLDAAFLRIIADCHAGKLKPHPLPEA